MVDANPGMFCPQDWYLGEAFAHLALSPIIGLPTHVVRLEDVNAIADEVLTDAVLLVGLYLQYPREPIFADYLWTADADAEGHRVYIGGTANGRGLEIHRHLHLTDRWRVPLWR
jgi:hypothetical protein